MKQGDEDKVLIDRKVFDSIVNELKEALNPKVFFSHDLLELSIAAHDIKNWRIRAALDTLQDCD